MKLPDSRRSRLAVLFVALVLTFETLAFEGGYCIAVQQLIDNDPRKRGNVTGTMVYARPKTLQRGQHLTREELVKHLTRIGYQQRPGGEAGTFSSEGNKLHVNSRLPEFPDVTLTFGRNQISAIVTANGEVDHADLEPEALGAFVKFFRGNSESQMRVRRYVLQISDVSESMLRDAIISSEDKRFDSHRGLDYINLVKAAFEGRGGSSLSQQTTKNCILQDQTHSLARKLKELFLTIALEQRFSKEEILQIYCNNIYAGHSTADGVSLLGFSAAAEELFGKKLPKDLTLSESAVLAGIANRPEFYFSAAHNGNYEPIRLRRDRVLDLMARNYPSRYPSAIIDHAKNEGISFIFASEHEVEPQLDESSRYFQSYAANQLEQLGIRKDDLASGLHLFTTADADLQKAAQRAVTEELRRLDTLVPRRFGRYRNGNPSPLQAALVAIDPKSGEILAMIGGRDFAQSPFNRATQAFRSPGSAIKPLVYLKAIERGRHRGLPFTAATVIDPKTDPVDGYRPTRHLGGADRARVLLARSDNGAAVVAAHDATLDEVQRFLQSVTGSDPVRTGMMAIGGAQGSEVTVLDLARAYSIFANNGLEVTATPFSTAYKDGVELKPHQPAPTRAADQGATFIVTQMMKSVMGQGPDGDWGTARRSMSLAGLGASIQIAGKTGTGQTSDLWFCSVSPRLVVTVWVGMDDNSPLRMSDGFEGAKAAMPIWAQFIQSVAKYRPDLLEGRFEMPESVVELKVDPTRGCVTDGNGINEFFIRGRQPSSCEQR